MNVFKGLNRILNRSYSSVRSSILTTNDLIFNNSIKCELLAVEASDLAVVNSARISFDTEHTEMTKADTGLVGYLLRNKHGTPFEHGFFKFRVECPIFVIREHHRHRTHSYNEMSGRYTLLNPHFYIPDKWRQQIGKPGSYSYIDFEENTDELDELTKETYSKCWQTYLELMEAGVAKEQARMVLPVGIFTKMIWSCNPRSLMHFIGLRGDKSAQQEIQTVARAGEEALKQHMPVTYAAFVANGRIAP